MGTWIFCRKETSALRSILSVALIFLRVSSSSSESLASSTDTISQTSTFPSVDESSATRSSANANDIPGIVRDRALEENSFQKPAYQLIYSEDNFGNDKENFVDFKTDDSNSNHEFSELLNAKIRKATMGFLHKRPWFHSWSGRKRQDDLAWKYADEVIGRGLPKAPKPENNFGDMSQSANTKSSHKTKRAHSNSRPRGNSFTTLRLDETISDRGKIKSKYTKTKHISELKSKYTLMNADKLVKTKAGYSEVVPIKGAKNRLKRSASIMPLGDDLYLQLNPNSEIVPNTKLDETVFRKTCLFFDNSQPIGKLRNTCLLRYIKDANENENQHFSESSGEKIDNELTPYTYDGIKQSSDKTLEGLNLKVPESIPSIYKGELKSLDNSLADPEIGFQPGHGSLNLKDSLETTKTVEVINDCIELLNGPNCIRLMDDVINDISQMTNEPPDVSSADFRDALSDDTIDEGQPLASSPNVQGQLVGDLSSGAMDSIRSSDNDESGLGVDPESLTEKEQGGPNKINNFNKENRTALVKAVENVLTDYTQMKEQDMLKSSDSSFLDSPEESSMKDQDFGFMLPTNPSIYAYKHLLASKSTPSSNPNPVRMRYANEMNGRISNLLAPSSSRPFNYFNTQALTPDNRFQVEKPELFFPNEGESRSYVRFLKMLSESNEMPRFWDGREFNARQPFPGSILNAFNDSIFNSQYNSGPFFQRNPVSQTLLESHDASIFKRPSFHSWSGKRNAIKDITYKRPSFHSWSGKRDGIQNVIIKRPSFHSWSGKRNAIKDLTYKRPSFHSWSGKRDVREIGKSFKRPSFHSWSGKRDGIQNVITKRPSFHSWSGKRNAIKDLTYKRPSFHSWSGKRDVREIGKSFKRPSFHSWSGKRDGIQNVITKRPSFHSWSGKREIGKSFKRPSFHSWSGKRDGIQNVITKKPSFHSWSGKRDVGEIINTIKRPSFHSWSGKRDDYQNVLSKRPSFHSWSGKRDDNQNMMSKRPSFHSWSG